MTVRAPVDEVAHAIGYAALDELRRHYRNRECRIPTRFERAGQLSQYVGADVARVLVERFGGVTLDFGNGQREPSSYHRVLHYRTAYRMKHEDIADAIGKTTRTVRKHLRAARTGTVPGGGRVSGEG